MNKLAVYNNISNNNYFSYRTMAYSLPHHTDEEEKHLAVLLFEKQDLNAAKKLILHNLYLVVNTVKKFSGYGLPEEDLAQEGSIGLMKAVKHYNPYKGVRLSFYALPWIEAEIKEFILTKWKMIKGNTTKAFKKLFFNYRKTLQEIKQSNPELNQLEREKKIANLLKVKEEEVREVAGYLTQEHVTIYADSDEDTKHVDIPVYDSDSYEETEEKEYQIGVLQKALKFLPEREKNILLGRKLENKSLQELANKHSISLERVRQIETQAIEHLKKIIKSD